MKIHRFIGDFTKNGTTVTITDKELVHQMNRVLKLSVGEHIVLGDGKGFEMEGVIETSAKSLIVIEVTGERENKNEPAKHVTLYLALLKRDNFELSVQKAVEVGVSKIVPMITDRTVKGSLNVERIETIIREAAEQSGRGIIPELSPVTEFKKAIADCDTKNAILFDLSGTDSANDISHTTDIFIGPEGGFTPTEVASAKDLGIHIGSLGSLTLRGETAAIVASYLAVHRS